MTFQENCGNEHGAFEDISDQWAKYVDATPQFEHVYAYTLFKLVGDVRGKRVLDLPCGSGEQSERCLLLGAKSVSACDLAPSQLALVKERIAKGNVLDRLTLVQGDATVPIPELQNGGHDILLSFFLFEYCSTEDELEQMAKNLFAAADPGAKLANLFFPCVNDAESIKKVKELVGAECTVDSPDIKPGDKVRITWHHMEGQPSMEVFHWPVDAGLRALEKAGFTQIRTGKMEADPEYRGKLDLKLMAESTENRWIYAVKPHADSSVEAGTEAREATEIAAAVTGDATIQAEKVGLPSA